MDAENALYSNQDSLGVQLPMLVLPFPQPVRPISTSVETASAPKSRIPLGVL
jgi:hypothetical protein